MIAGDTSTWAAFFQGEAGDDITLLVQALSNGQLLMVPAVLTELLSNPRLSPEIAKVIVKVPLIDLKPGYWERAGSLRAKVIASGRKARLGDALIAQTCIDRCIPLLTRDNDFRAFTSAAGLNLAISPRPIQ